MAGSSRRDPGRRVAPFVVAAVVAVVAVAVIAVWILRRATAVPGFASLADAPDATLVGTVAYLDWEMDACLRVVPAAGGATRTVVCLEGVNAGAGAVLDWLDDGRVAVTMYGEWQRIVDVGSGAVVDVPVDQVPSVAPDRRPANVSGDGRRLTATNDGGNAQIVLEEGGSTRVLLDAQGGDTYDIGTPQWSPDETFVITPDSAARLLVTTIGDEPLTRVLATELGGSFAATSSEI